MGFSPSEKHSTTTSILSNIVDASTGSFTQSLTISGTPVTGRDLYILIEDQKSTGTSGGTFTFGDWRTRDLNTLVTDDTGQVSLSSNQFALPAGTYRFEAHVPSVEVGQVKARLQNITDASTTLLGQSNYASQNLNSTPGGQREFVSGQFTITATKTFEIQHRSSVTRADFGFGTGDGNFGDHETFTRVEIWQYV